MIEKQTRTAPDTRLCDESSTIPQRMMYPCVTRSLSDRKRFIHVALTGRIKTTDEAARAE